MRHEDRQFGGLGDFPAGCALLLPFVICMLLLLPGASAQDGEAGKVLTTTFSRRDHSALRWVSAVEVDHDGIVYAATAFCVLSYDGVEWRTILGTDEKYFWSLDVDEDGRVWAGSAGDLGLFDVNRAGNKIFISLRDKLPQFEHSG